MLIPDTMDEILYNYLLVKNNGLATYGYTSDGRAIKSFFATYTYSLAYSVNLNGTFLSQTNFRCSDWN